MAVCGSCGSRTSGVDSFGRCGDCAEQTDAIPQSRYQVLPQGRGLNGVWDSVELEYTVAGVDKATADAIALELNLEDQR